MPSSKNCPKLFSKIVGESGIWSCPGWNSGYQNLRCPSNFEICILSKTKTLSNMSFSKILAGADNWSPLDNHISSFCPSVLECCLTSLVDVHRRWHCGTLQLVAFARSSVNFNGPEWLTMTSACARSSVNFNGFEWLTMTSACAADRDVH